MLKYIVRGPLRLTGSRQQLNGLHALVSDEVIILVEGGEKMTDAA